MRKKNQSSGTPYETTKLTLNQDLQMREIELALYEIDKETMIELYLQLQKQLFKFNNLLVPLLKEAKRNANTQQNS